MERNIKKNGLVNLAVALVIFLASLGATLYAKTLAGEVASAFLGLGVLVALISWFQMRLEENERLEKLELDELAHSRGASLFEARDAGSYPARNAREQFEKFFVPGFCIVVLLLEVLGAWLFWRWSVKLTAGMVPAREMAALALFGIFALLLFLFGRFSVTIARLENHRLLRPSANFLLAGAYACSLTALGIAGVKVGFPQSDLYIGRAFCVLFGLLAAEMLVSLLLEIYRPRVKGKVARALYDSRVVAVLAQPESLFTTAAQALDYQFGFKVSETWFFRVLRKGLPVLLAAQLVALILSTCIVFIGPGEQGVLEHFGHLDKARPVLNPGGHLVWPWPVDHVYRYRTGQIQTFDVGFKPDKLSESQNTVLWTVVHTKEVNFLVGNSEPATITNQIAESGQPVDMSEVTKVSSVGLIDVSIPVQFQITNVLDWAYKNADQTNLLQDVAGRDLVRYLAGVDLNAVLSKLRTKAARFLKNEIQNDANRHHLGVKILFVGVQDIHPPVKVAGVYEKVVAAGQDRIADTNNAVANAIATNSLAGANAFADVSKAQAAEVQTKLSSWARADLFTNQIAAFDAAPSVYRQRAYFHMFPKATANAQKYVMLVTNTHDVLVFDLQNKIRADLLNLNVTNSP